MQRFQASWPLIFIAAFFILVTYRLYFIEIKSFFTPGLFRKGNLKIIVAFGDSLTEGLFDWPKSRSFHPYTIKLQKLINYEIRKGNSEIDIIVRNFGVSGERLRDSMKQRLRKVVTSTKPDFVIILGGTNDLLDTDKEVADYAVDKRRNEIIQDMQTLHLYCHYKGIPTAAISIPETAIDDRNENATVSVMRRAINKEMRDFVTRNQTKSVFVDISSEIPRKDNEQYWDDGVHFSPMGYDKMGELIYRELKDVLKSWMSNYG